MPGWRRYSHDLDGAWHAIEDLRETIGAMQIADEVAERVKQELRDSRRVHFTLAQKAGAIIVACFVIAGTIHSWIA